MAAQRLEDLDVWQLCEEIRLLVAAGIAPPHVATHGKFCEQILSAAEDALSDVGEGFSRFRPREFAQFLGYAISSITEVLERTRFAHSRKYFDNDTTAKLIVLCTRADKAMRSLRRYLWSVAKDDVPYHPDAEPPRRRKRRRHTKRRDDE
jgi:four helix bundle protein